MGNERNFWVMGGDLRQARLAELLAADGHTVHTFALEGPLAGVKQAGTLAEAERADCVVLPLPAADGEGRLNAPLSGTEHPMPEVLDALRPGQAVCAGRVDPATAALAAERGLTLHDYFAREELAVANAVPTALAKGHRGFRPEYAGIPGKNTAASGAGGRPRKGVPPLSRPRKHRAAAAGP